MINKQDCDAAIERVEAWWNRSIVDRVPVKITAPKVEIDGIEGWFLSSAFPMGYIGDKVGELSPLDKSAGNLEQYFFDPSEVIPRLEKAMEATLWLGEAIPVMFPVSIGIPCITASYLGCPLKFIDSTTAWSEPIIADWRERPSFCFDTRNKWWQKSVALLKEASARAQGQYLVGIPETNGASEILNHLRGTANFAIDTIEHKIELKQAMEELNRVWLRYWQAAHGLVHQHEGGYTNWMAIWSEAPFTDLQSDISCILSPETFDEIILPYLRKQTEWIGRTVYHLDGPDALRHLDSLLSLPKLTGIQWIPGVGEWNMVKWIPLLKKIQKAGKLIHVICHKGEIEPLIRELYPEGLLLETSCGSRKEAEETITTVRRFT